MTTLTKIFIVVQTVIAIVISMVVIQYTAQSTNFRQLADDWRGRAEQELALRAAADNQNKLIVEHLDKVNRTQQEELRNQGAKIEQIAGELSGVKNELLAERQKTASLTGQVTQLTNMTKAGDEERKQLQAQLESTRKDNAGLRADNFKLAETNQKLDLQRQLYDQEIRLLKEQNYSINERLDKLRARGPVAAASDSSPPASGDGKVQPATETETSPILGQITDVRDSLASISVGAAQGVKNGMDFIIYRNGQYLGKMRINKVLPEQAAGELLNAQGSIRSGDKVTDKFQF